MAGSVDLWWLLWPWSSPNGVNVEQLETRRLQPLFHNLAETFQNLVSEIVILLALRAQTFPIKRNRAHRFNGVRVKFSLVGRQQPRPAQNLSLTQGCHHVRRFAD
jgi:hypothetical protein